LESKILKRLKARIKQGMVKEVEKLHKQGISWKKLEAFGLEYKYSALFLQNKINLKEMESLLFTAIKQYTKRQKTWWKRNKEIKWSENATELQTIAENSIK
jgi:tRNA dimethylallyltransferase